MIEFEILIDDLFANINTDAAITPVDNKRVLSIINDFEDGLWRFNKFQNFIWDNIAETSLSTKERESLVNKNHSLLISAAKSLRLIDKENDISKGSELAEIVLYGIMKHHYGALPVVPKIFYKQNSQDNAKGADSVHIVIENDGTDFSIWFGEAKFYNDIANSRLGTIIDSVENSLFTDKLRKENSIITNVSDIDNLIQDIQLRNRIIAVLASKESLDKLKPKLHIPILLLHECDITKHQTILTPEYRVKLINYHKQRSESYFMKQVKKIGGLHLYSEIRFHIILFPVPDKKEIIDKFVTTADFYKNK